MNNKNKKSLLPLMVMLVVLTALVGAGFITTFSNGLVSEQLNFTGDQNITRTFQMNNFLEMDGPTPEFFIQGLEFGATGNTNTFYMNGTQRLQDGIYPLNDTALQNGEPSNGNLPINFGWGAAGNAPQYNNSEAYFANLSIQLNPFGTSSTISFVSLNNGSFNGTVVVHFKDNQSTAAKWHIQVQTSTGQQFRMGKRDVVSTTHYTYLDGVTAVCDETSITYYTNFTQFYFDFNVSGTGDIYGYINGELCHIFLSGVGLDDIEISSNADGDAHEELYIDAFAVFTNNTLNFEEGVSGTFPTDPYLQIGTPDATPEWSVAGELKTNVSTGIANEDFNLAHNGISCNCVGCSLSNDICSIPFVFHSDTQGTLQYSSFKVNETWQFVLGEQDSNPTCVATTRVKFFQWGIKDEINTTNVSATSITGNITTYLGSVRISKKIDFSDPETGFGICVRPNWATLSVDHFVTFKAGQFPERTIFIEGDTINNVTTQRNMYMLHDDKGVDTTFVVLDATQKSISNAKIIAKRLINNSFQQLDFTFSDSAGQGVLFLDSSTQIQITVSALGFLSSTFSITPTSTETFTVTLVAESGMGVVNGTGIRQTFFPDFSPLNNDTIYPFQFNMTSTFFDIASCTLFIIDENGTILNQNSSSFTTTTCDIRISFNTSSFSFLQLNATYTVNNSNFTVINQYTVFSTYVGDLSLQTFIDDLTAFGLAGFNSRTRLLISFFTILIIVGFAARFAGLTNPEGAILLVISLVWFFSFINWMPVTNFSFPTLLGAFPIGVFLEQYIIFILMALLGFSYIIPKQVL